MSPDSQDALRFQMQQEAVQAEREPPVPEESEQASIQAESPSPEIPPALQVQLLSGALLADDPPDPDSSDEIPVPPNADSIRDSAETDEPMSGKSVSPDSTEKTQNPQKENSITVPYDGRSGPQRRENAKAVSSSNEKEHHASGGRTAGEAAKPVHRMGSSTEKETLFLGLDSQEAARKGKERLKRKFQESAAVNVGGSQEGAQGIAGTGGRSDREATEESIRTGERLMQSLWKPLAYLLGVLVCAWILLLCVTLPETANLVYGNAIREVIREVNKDYNMRLEAFRQTPHDELRTEGTPPDWRTVLAVYTAKTSQDIESADDLEMTEEQKALLKTIFWDMNALSAHTEPDGADVQLQTVPPTMVPWDPSDPTASPEPTDPTQPSNPVTLVIVMQGRTAAEAADFYGLDAEQRFHMEEILQPENAMLLNEVLWDIPYISATVIDGWAYPLPEEGTVTEWFGMRVHPITGEWKLHQGLDIGIAEGTPIFAVRSGTVTVATYNDSAGNYVMIDHGDGFGSIYMHMAASIVSAGQEVAAGQVIGYVGSTGESTGPHLHIGISYNGIYLDPTGYLVYRKPEETTVPYSSSSE